mgnify:FL=1
MAGKAVVSAARRAEILEAVLAGMSEGKTVADVARAEKVSPGTVRQWIADDEAIFARYQRMRPLLGASFAEEAVRVARDTRNENVPVDRLLIETLKWAAAKNAPMEYGEKQTVEHQGAQELRVKVVEEDAPTPVRAGATAVAVMQEGMRIALPAPEMPRQGPNGG